MKIALVAGPDPGHALPMFSIAQQCRVAGHETIIYTGPRWHKLAVRNGLTHAELPGLAPRLGENDQDAGRKIHERAGHMAQLLAPLLARESVTTVIGDVITAAGGLAAELINVPWFEFHPHPLYHLSREYPPFGGGLQTGVGISYRIRDSILRSLTRRSIRQGQKTRAYVRADIGLPASDTGPLAYFVGTFPALEYARADWPHNAHIVGPHLYEPTQTKFIPHEHHWDAATRGIVVSPSTAAVGYTALEDLVCAAAKTIDPARNIRFFVCTFTPRPSEHPHISYGSVRQDTLLQHADIAIGGGGHGFVCKAIHAGVPMILFPGGGDQREVAQRIHNKGAGLVLHQPSVEEFVETLFAMIDREDFRRFSRSLSHNVPGPATIVTLIEKYCR